MSRAQKPKPQKQRRTPKGKKPERARAFDVVGLAYRLTPAVIAQLAELAEGEPLNCRLEREPMNKADPNAVRVYVDDERAKLYFHIGYLRREVAAVFAQAMDKGTLHTTSVRLTYVNTEHNWGRVKIAFLKTP